MKRCFGCGGNFSDTEGPVHAYMLATPGCWSAYGSLLAAEYQDPVRFARVHRLTVDSYAVQHPGDPGDRRAVQSIWLHLISLWMVLRMGADHADATRALQRASHRRFDAAVPYPRDFAITLEDMIAAGDDNYVSGAERWAEASLQGWAHLHEAIARLAGSL